MYIDDRCRVFFLLNTIMLMVGFFPFTHHIKFHIDSENCGFNRIHQIYLRQRQLKLVFYSF